MRRLLLATLLLLPTAGAGSAAAAPEPTTQPQGRFNLHGDFAQGGLLRGRVTEQFQELTFNGKPLPTDFHGYFVIGLDRDAPPSAEILLRRGDGTTATVTIQVAPRDWRLEHVNVARRPGGASEDFMRRREPELARIVAARTVRSAATGWAQQFIWPARGRISGRFGSQRVYRGEPGSYHNGVDVAAGTGAPVSAPADGVVVLATEKPFSLEGNLVIIDHGHGLNSAFLHLSRIDVREGQAVRQGDRIGAVGATGRATGPHLHWALTWNGARLDPELVVGPIN